MVGMSGAYGGHNGSESRQTKEAVVVGAPEMGLGAMGVVHKVAPPPAQSTASKMKGKVKETFFPDDPFRSFKGQPQRAKFVLAAKYLFPVLEWAPGYSLSLFKSDLIAGLTIASLAIPQACTTHPLSNFKILEL
jgi:sulfate transporter 3